MAFGLFKKKTYADVIYTNGHVFTQDPEFPWASAVACRGDRILAVGDLEGMDEIRTEDTQLVDLGGRYMFPGFIDAHGTPVLKTFADRYLEIDPVWDLDTVLESVAEYAGDDQQEVIFAYGYNENILSDYDELEDAHRLLDAIEEERPVILLGISGVHCWCNTAAGRIIDEAAEADGLQYVSPDYVLNLFSPFDFEETETRVRQTCEELCERGITSVLNLYSPEYFSNIYQDCLITMNSEGYDVRQRFMGSLYVNRPLHPELILHKLSTGRTNCTEISDVIRFDFLKLDVCEDANLADFSQEALETICLTAAEKNYHIHLDALDRSSLEQAEKTFHRLREKGCRKNTLVLAAEGCAESGEEEWLCTWPTDYLNRLVFEHCTSVEEAIDELTVKAAAIVGRENDLGSIEKGKLADFTIFDENPFDADLKKFSRMNASATILGGRIVYDEQEAADDEMCDLLMSMRL